VSFFAFNGWDVIERERRVVAHGGCGVALRREAPRLNMSERRPQARSMRAYQTTKVTLPGALTTKWRLLLRVLAV